MKKLLLLLLLLPAAARAQYQTPGTGIRWTLAQLAAAPGSNVTNAGAGTFAVNGNLRLSPRDTLIVNTNATLRLASLAQVNIDGVLLVNPPDSVLITAQNPAAPFHSLWFSGSSEGSRLRKTVVEYGGGLKVVDASLVLDSCVVRYQVARIGSVNTNSGAVSLSGGAPRISHCRLYGNARSAILSPANRPTSPVISDCQIINNDTENANYPQLNLGPGGATPIVVERCRIVGRYNMAGGLALSNLVGSAGSRAVVRGNYLANNRYGIAVLGAGFNVTITRNVIENNNTNPNALTGGSGINLQGSNTLTGVASRNVLRGNLWGVTTLRTSMSSTTPGPTVSFGNLASTDTTDVGRNLLYNNGNGGQIYDFYVEMPDDVQAQNNDWGSSSAAVIESHVVHRFDRAALGLLNYQPFRNTVLATRPAAPLLAQVAPNPAHDVLTVTLPAPGPAALSLRDALGRTVRTAAATGQHTVVALSIIDLPPGTYLLDVQQAATRATARVVVN